MEWCEVIWCDVLKGLLRPERELLEDVQLQIDGLFYTVELLMDQGKLRWSIAGCDGVWGKTMMQDVAGLISSGNCWQMEQNGRSANQVWAFVVAHDNFLASLWLKRMTCGLRTEPPFLRHDNDIYPLTTLTLLDCIGRRVFSLLEDTLFSVALYLQSWGYISALLVYEFACWHWTLACDSIRQKSMSCHNQLILLDTTQDRVISHLLPRYKTTRVEAVGIYRLCTLQ